LRKDQKKEAPQAVNPANNRFENYRSLIEIFKPINSFCIPVYQHDKTFIKIFLKYLLKID